jgi:uncharacterized membrane protein
MFLSIFGRSAGRAKVQGKTTDFGLWRDASQPSFIHSEAAECWRAESIYSRGRNDVCCQLSTSLALYLPQSSLITSIMTTQEVSYVLAEPQKDGIAVSGSAVGKQGHSCCGSCCDSRRAVIIVNIINVCFASSGLLSLGGVMAASSQSYDDDEVQAAFSSLSFASMGVMSAFVLIAIKLAGTCVGIYGAMTYNIWMVGVSLAVYCLNFATGIINSNIFTLVMYGCFAYPHFFFIQEVRRGIMSEVNYVNEKQSCCCV